MVNRIKERSQVGVDDPVYFLRAYRVRECVKRIVLATPRPKTVRKTDEVGFIYGVQNLDDRTRRDERDCGDW